MKKNPTFFRFFAAEASMQVRGRKQVGGIFFFLNPLFKITRGTEEGQMKAMEEEKRRPTEKGNIK